MREPDDRELLLILGRWLARWRAQVGVSQRVLAAQAGIDQGGLSRVERGLQACGARRLARLIAALDDLSGRTPLGRITPPPVRPDVDGFPPFGRPEPWDEPDP